MLSVDFYSAVNGCDADNFTTALFRLLLKADKRNLGRLEIVFPVEAQMVLYFHGDEGMFLIGEHSLTLKDAERLAEAACAKLGLPGYEP
jgi:hypothetical protein